MNKKAGLYVGAIALAAIAIIATILFNSISDASAQEGRSQAKAILDLKWEMQNSQFVAGKAIADAVADASYVGGACVYNSATAQTNISNYLSNLVSKQALQGCSIAPASILINALNPAAISVSMKFTCQKKSGSLDASYAKTVVFNKKVETSGNCRVIVTNTSVTPNEVDVDHTEP
jgi:hypothetical protein